MRVKSEGFLRSALAIMRVDLDAPDHTTLSRRGQQFELALGRIPAQGPLHLVERVVGAVASVTVVVPPAKTASVSPRGPRSGLRDRTIKRVKELGRRR